MPLYESVRTGKRQVMDEARAAIYKPGVWRKVSDETPAEVTRREAAERKVELETQLSLAAEQAEFPQAYQAQESAVEDTAPTGKAEK